MALSLELGLIYLISELLLTVTRRSRSKTGMKQDRSTLGIIWLVIAVSILAGVFVALNFRARGAAVWTNIRNRGRGAVCRRIAAALVGHYHSRPFFHCGCDNSKRPQTGRARAVSYRAASFVHLLSSCRLERLSFAG